MTEKFNLADYAEGLAYNREDTGIDVLKNVFDFWNHLWATSMCRMFGRQREIAMKDYESEMTRLMPGDDKWSVENGDEAQKVDRGAVDWGDL